MVMIFLVYLSMSVCHKRIIDITVVSKKLFYVALDGTVYISMYSGRAD